ncbi:MAG: hypothetical protein JWO36_6507 [Myxococcales bacterium]|nr:hypothetical protein [Myxococcales bacterium]
MPRNVGPGAIVNERQVAARRAVHPRLRAVRVAKAFHLLAPISAYVALLATGCIFDANYADGRYTCKDGACPSALVCNAAKQCVAPIDASVPDADDAMIDARIPAFTCADPGIVTGTGGTFMGSTTAPQPDTSSSLCSGAVMNGRDAIYRVAITAGQHLLVSISTSSGTYPVNAYVIASCTVAPNTPACEGAVAAASGNPINLTPAAGQHFIVVDNPNPSLSGPYALTVTVN